MDGSPGESSESSTPYLLDSPETTTSGGSHFVRLTPAAASEPAERKPAKEYRTMFEIIVDPHGDRKPDGTPYLVDLCPNINGSTERDKIIPAFPWKVLQEQNVAEWRCWKMIQGWRRFAHSKLRLAYKRRLWGIYGDLLKMYSYRLKGWKHHLDRDFPPGTLPDDGSREQAYPNARHINRSEPRPSEDYDHPVVKSWTSRHQIMH